jgi:hypothetical protein
MGYCAYMSILLKTSILDLGFKNLIQRACGFESMYTTWLLLQQYLSISGLPHSIKYIN